MNDKSDNAANFVRDLRNAAARNPVSAALIGMGALWMLTGAKSPAIARDAFRDVADRIPHAFDNVRSSLQESGGSIKRAAASSMDAVRERGEDTFDGVAEYRAAMPDPSALFDSAHDGLSNLLKAQPLALGVIGIAIGAGIAAALPKTDVEDAYLGEASQTLKTHAAEIAGDQLEKTSTIATNVIDEVSAEAQQQGLTPDGAKAAMANITGRVGRVVDAAKTVAKRNSQQPDC